MFKSPKKSKQRSQSQPSGYPPPLPNQQSQQQPPSKHHHIPNPFRHSPKAPKDQTSSSFSNSGYTTPQRAAMSPAQHGMSRVSIPTSPVGSSNSEQQRKLVTDKIIADCYSKVVIENGIKLNEISYITHIGVMEFSHSPSAPPPSEKAAGSTKHRILVLCKKHTGRMQLQKGKFQSDKNGYQIGRTWDLSELQLIKRVGSDGLILQLNKTYYWKCDEDERRIWKFSRYLCQHYGIFMGKYPKLEGFNLDDFMLPPTPKSPGSPSSRSPSVRDPIGDSNSMRSRSSRNNTRASPALPPVPSIHSYGHSKTPSVGGGSHSQVDLYKDMDFTANGALPQKPMKIMARDNQPQSTLDPGPSLYGPSQKSSPFGTTAPPQKQTFSYSRDTKENNGYPQMYSQGQYQQQQQSQRQQQPAQQQQYQSKPQPQPPQQSQQQSQPPPQQEQKKSNQHPYYQKSPMYGLDTSSKFENDSQSFIFNTEEFLHDKSSSAGKSPVLNDQRKFTGESLKTVAESTPIITQNESTPPPRSMHSINHNKNGSSVSQKSVEEVVKEFTDAIPSAPKPKMAASANVPDFGVEEITDDSEDDQRPAPTFSIRKRNQQARQQQQQQPSSSTVPPVVVEDHHDTFNSFTDKSSRYDDKTFGTQKGLGIYPENTSSFIGESTNIENQNRVDSHMQEIQDMLNSHIDEAKVEDSFEFPGPTIHDNEDDDLNEDLNNVEPLSKPLTKTLTQPSNDSSSEIFEGDSIERGLNIVKKADTPEGQHSRAQSVQLPKTDQDDQVSTMLKEIGWSVKDNSDSLMKKLAKEMNKSKQDIVSKLVNIDLKNNSGDDIGSALNEVDNMTHIFQKMEVRLKLMHNDLQNSVY
ncbi:SEC3 Exocyst complex component SEC3 [Candida maltosa Xu316]